MKYEFGKWLMDIAKYIATAVILTSVFEGIRDEWLIYATGLSAIALTFLLGLWLVKDKKEDAAKKVDIEEVNVKKMSVNEVNKEG